MHGCNFLRLSKRKGKKKKRKKKKFDTNPFDPFSRFILSRVSRRKLRRIFMEWWFILRPTSPSRLLVPAACAADTSYSWQLQLTATYTYVWLSCAAAWDDDSPNAPFFIVSATLAISMDLRLPVTGHRNTTQENAISPSPSPRCRLGNWPAARLIRLIILFEFESRYSDLYCSRSPIRLIYLIYWEWPRTRIARVEN